MKEVFRKHPFFVLLLPVFFVLHGYTEHLGYLTLRDSLPLLIYFLAGTVLTQITFKFLLKDSRKAALMTLLWMSFYFFFGALFDFLKAHAWQFTYKYSVLITFILTISIVLFIILRITKKDTGKITIFFNLLFCIFIITDLISITGKQLQNLSKKNNEQHSGAIPDSSAKPDIYLLLFDEYSGNTALNQWFDYDNRGLDSFLLSKNFFVASEPSSNYEHTPYSMASMLNMEYLPWYKAGTLPSREEVIKCGTLIRNNKVTEFLQAGGYEIVNLSIFDLNNHPAPINQRFLAVNTRLITEETLLSRICIDFEWFLQKNKLLRKLFPVNTREDDRKNIETCHQLTLKEAARKSSKPKFVYTHLLVPHLPNLFDHNGNQNTEVVTNASPLPQRITGYLNYLQFANKLIKELVTTIQQQTNNQAVILVMSDHGFRWTKEPPSVHLTNNNLNAVYLPGHQYGSFTNSLTNVNQFRILFNTLFSQQFPLLKDSCVKMERQ